MRHLIFSGQDSDGHVSVPRSTVRFLAWLVPLIAILAFLLGMMVGQLSSGGSADHSPPKLGAVTIEVEPVTTPVSVCLLLPSNANLTRCLEPTALLPSSFQAINNPAIDAIHEAGGGVCRVDDSGARFDVQTGRSYWLIVLSPSTRTARTLNKEETALLSQYFLPIETLTGGADLHFERFTLSGDLRRSIRLKPSR